MFASVDPNEANRHGMAKRELLGAHSRFLKGIFALKNVFYTFQSCFSKTMFKNSLWDDVRLTL